MTVTLFQSYNKSSDKVEKALRERRRVETVRSACLHKFRKATG